MKKIVLFVLMACAVSVIASAQEHLTYTFEKKISADQAPAVRVVEGKQLTMVFEMKSVPNAPYQAEAVTESTMTLADGNRIVKKTATRVYRDSAGRTRKETLGPDGQVVSVFISDPAGSSSYAIDPASGTATRTAVAYAVAHTTGDAGGATVSHGGVSGGTATWTMSTGTGAGAVEGQPLQKSVIVTTGQGGVLKVESHDSAKWDVVKEDLGEQTIEGVLAKGSRTTTTIPVGAIDNEQPIRIVSEEWFSAELQVLVLTKHSDPRVGETTYRLTNVSRTEPEKSLFELPAGYRVKTPAAGTHMEVIKK